MNTSIQHILAENVRRERKKTGLNKFQFCLTAGVSRPVLDRIEAGEGNPTLETLEDLASCCDIEIWELLKPRH